MKKVIIPVMLGLLLVGGGAFYGGIQYSQAQTKSARAAGAARFAQGGSAGMGARGVRGTGGPAGAAGGFTTGEVLSKDDKSITIKMRDGGSKIVFLSGTTQITKSASGSAADLATGTQVMVQGSANSDGSLSAQSIQIRPAMPAKTDDTTNKATTGTPAAH